MKASRLLSSLLLLQAQGRLTERELSERLEVSQRTVHRDMEALSSAGIPITALRGAQGGWQLEKEWRTQVPGLDEAELRALLMTQPRALGDSRLVAAAERAFGKLMAALPSRMHQQAVAMRARLHVDATGWRVSTEDLTMLPAVQDAVARDCKLAFEYTRSDGQTAPRTVDPLGIVSKGSAWYLVARAPNGLRTYRVSRMKNLTLLASTFERPRNFDLAAFWKASTARLEQERSRYEATVSLHPQAALSIKRWCPTSPVEKQRGLAAGWVTLRVQFDSEEQARFFILGLGAKAKAVAPVALCERIFADARAIVDCFSRDEKVIGKPTKKISV